MPTKIKKTEIRTSAGKFCQSKMSKHEMPRVVSNAFWKWFGQTGTVFEVQMAFESPANIVNLKLASAMAKERYFDD